MLQLWFPIMWHEYAAPANRNTETCTRTDASAGTAWCWWINLLFFQSNCDELTRLQLADALIYLHKHPCDPGMPEWITPDFAQSTKSPQHVRNTVPPVGISYIWHPFLKNPRKTTKRQKPKHEWQSWRMKRMHRHKSQSSELKLHSGHLTERQSVISVFTSVNKSAGGQARSLPFPASAATPDRYRSSPTGREFSGRSGSSSLKPDTLQIQTGRVMRKIPMLNACRCRKKKSRCAGPVENSFRSGLSARWCRRGWSTRVGRVGVWRSSHLCRKLRGRVGDVPYAVTGQVGISSFPTAVQDGPSCALRWHAITVHLGI